MSHEAADSVITIAILLATVAAVLAALNLPYVRQLDKLDWLLKPRNVPAPVAKLLAPVGRFFDAVNDIIDRLARVFGSGVGLSIRALGCLVCMAAVLAIFALLGLALVKFIKWAWEF